MGDVELTIVIILAAGQPERLESVAVYIKVLACQIWGECPTPHTDPDFGRTVKREGVSRRGRDAKVNVADDHVRRVFDAETATGQATRKKR